MADETTEPTRAEIDAMPGPVLVEFGAADCGHCRSLKPRLERMLEGHPEIRHLKIEDGPGRRLGRSFGVKLWPTLVFLRDGEILEQVARPEVSELRAGLEAIAGG